MAAQFPWLADGYGAPNPYEGRIPYETKFPWLNQDKQTSNGGGLMDTIGSLSAYTYPDMVGTSTKRTGNIADELGQIMRAMYDPGSPMYQNAYKQNRQSSRNNIAEFLMEAGRQNRKLASLGRVSLFDPERGGETQFRSMIKAYQDADSMAHENTIKQLADAGGIGRARYLIDSHLADTQAQNVKRKGLAFSDIAKALPTIMGLF